MWPIVVEQSICPGPDSGERLMAYAKRCGGPMMVDFLFPQLGPFGSHRGEKLEGTKC